MKIIKRKGILVAICSVVVAVSGQTCACDGEWEDKMAAAGMTAGDEAPGTPPGMVNIGGQWWDDEYITEAEFYAREQEWNDDMAEAAAARDNR